MLTGIRDVDYKILNELDDKSLVSFCSTNKKADEYCDDQNFWLNRILIKFPFLSLDILRKYEGNMSWSDYYIDLRKFEKLFPSTIQPNNLKLIKESIRKGRLDHIMILVNKKVFNSHIKSNTITIAITSNQLEILKYLVEQKWPVGYDYILLEAISLGYLDMVKYALENGADIHFDNDEPLREAVKTGNLEIVKYLVEKGADIQGYGDYNSFVEIAYRKGYMNIVDYLVSQGAPDPR